MDDMGILPNYDVVIVHDFWKSYYKYLCDHGLCDTHLLRELTNISENYEPEWSGMMVDLLLVIKGCVDETRETSDSLTPGQIKDFETMYDYITKMGLEENPPPLDLNTKPKKRGRKKQTKPKNLLDRFVDYKADILRFMHDWVQLYKNTKPATKKQPDTYRSSQFFGL
jgi:hypothetical protein